MTQLHCLTNASQQTAERAAGWPRWLHLRYNFMTCLAKAALAEFTVHASQSCRSHVLDLIPPITSTCRTPAAWAGSPAPTAAGSAQSAARPASPSVPALVSASVPRLSTVDHPSGRQAERYEVQLYSANTHLAQQPGKTPMFAIPLKSKP